MGAIFWGLLAILFLVGCIIVVASMGLGMLAVGAAVIMATTLVLAIIAAGCWAVIISMKAWDGVRAWWACVCRGRA